jgi:class 3 adenylate cyclase
MALKRLSFTHTFKSPLSKVWRVISDTDLINSAAGLPAVAYKDEPQPDGTTRRLASYSAKGMTFAYEELPYRWVHEQFYDVWRIYTSGPYKRLRFAVFLKPKGEGCEAEALWEYETKGFTGTMVGTLGIKLAGVEPFKKVFAKLDERLLKDQALKTGSMILARPGVISDGTRATQEQRTRIEAMAKKVHEIFDSPIIEKLAAALIDKPDMELRRMRPFAFAREWRTEKQNTLNVFLAATRAGLLKMRWDVICPHCRGDKQNLTSLSNVKEKAFCPACNVNFDVDLDRSLEAVFTPHPQVREIEEATYCLGGPGMTPHVVYQRMFEPGEKNECEMTLPQGRYRLRVTGEKSYRWIECGSGIGVPPMSGAQSAPEDSGKKPVPLQTFIIRDTAIDGTDAIIPAAPTKFAFENASKRRCLVVLESVEWAQDALSAGELVADQRFRDLFSSEVLAPGVKLAVESTTILFTDLVGSTAMYDKLGDAKAFSLVWTHFDILHEIVERYRGAIVKTIGDAIMAVFARPEDALAAADELHARVAEYCKGKGHEHPVQLKVGLHEGPSIAVTANERLDYFGQTVNLAARVQAMSEGEDIVLTRAFAQKVEDAKLLRDKGWKSEEKQAYAKGFPQPIPVLRFTRGLSPKGTVPVSSG